MSVSVQQVDFDAGAEIAALSAGREDVGAVASFVGLVRADKSATSEVGAGDTASVQAMTLEHYPGMTEKASHRGDAFAACEFIMDYLKTRAPFWKKEETPAGGRWVDARESDDTAAGRWQSGAG